MKVLLSPTFIEEVRKLIKSSSHVNCEQSLIDNIYKCTFDEIICTGSPKCLNNSGDKNQLIRRRIENSSGQGRSGGFRLYLWAFKVDDEICLMHIHPKTGRRSTTNLTREERRKKVSEFLIQREKGDLIETTYITKNNVDSIINSEEKTLIFKA